MKKFLASLGHAIHGIRHAVAEERNLKIQLAAFILAMVAALLLRISRLELLAVLGISALVLALELANTALERLADRVSSEPDSRIGIAKDVMAGAVLLAAVFAAVIGLLVFLPPLLLLLRG